MTLRRRTAAGDQRAFDRLQRKLERRRSAYQYATRVQTLTDNGKPGRIEAQPSRHIAETIARDWCISPLRGTPRQAELLRRRGYDGEWEVVATWKSPEATR